VSPLAAPDPRGKACHALRSRAYGGFRQRRQGDQNGEVEHIREIVFIEHAPRAVDARLRGRGAGTPAVPPGSAPRGARATPPGVGPWPPPIRPASEMVWWGARHGRVVTNAVRSPVRPATRWIRVVSRASARVIAGRIVVSRRASIDWPAPGGPRRRTLWAERLHLLQHGIPSVNCYRP
jgi:hypothetical protein